VILGGNNQTDTVLSTLPIPLRIQVLDGSTVVPNARIVWSFPDGSEAPSMTDPYGMADMRWTLGKRAGLVTAQATFVGHPSVHVQFSATARPGRAVSLRGPSEWDGAAYPQIGLGGQPLLFDYTVAVVDSYGNPIPEASIEWEVMQGEGSIAEVPLSEGWARARLTLGPDEGVHQVRAVATGLPELEPITFEATTVTAVVEVDTGISFYDADEGAVITVPAFHPYDITVTVGQSVGWLWATTYDPEYDYQPSLHDVVFEDDPTTPTSSEPQRFGSLVRTFTEPGTYRFRCTLHSADFEAGHVGVVTVVSS